MTGGLSDEGSLGLLTLADIAELAGVGRSAVSNWRKRSPDFPKPVAGTAASPLFDPGQVKGFLQGRGRSVGRPGLERRLMKAMDLLRNVVPVTAAVEAICAATTLRYVATVPQAAPNLAESVPRPELWTSAWSAPKQERVMSLARAAREIEAEVSSLRGLLEPPLWNLPPEASELLDVVDEVSVDDTTELFEAALGALRRATGRGGSELITAAPLIDLMLRLAAPVTDTVYDPAAGLGGALLEAARVAKKPVQLRGQEIGEAAWRLANLRLIVHGLDGWIAHGDTLLADADPNLRASVIVLDPPYGLKWRDDPVAHDPRWRFGPPTSGSADMAWLQHAVAHLAPGGRAFVVLTPASLFRAGADGRVRHELVRSGAVEAVIGLPGGLAPHTGIPLALWVLTRPGESAARDRVLLIDGTAGNRGEFADWLPQIAELYHGWRSTGQTAEVDWAVAPTVLDLLSIDATLVPTRWLPSALQKTDADQLIRELHDNADRLTNVMRALGRVRPVRVQEVAGRDDHDLRRPTVDRLAVDGLVKVLRGTRVPREELDEADGDVPVITARHIRDGVLPAPADCPRVPADMLERRVGRTETGDVLVLTEGERIRAAVVEEGGAVAAEPLWILRPQGGWVDSTYLAACLASEWNTRHTRGSTISRANVRDLEVPLLPLTEQRQLAARVKQLQDLRRQADQAAALARALSDRLVDGVAAGVLTVDDSTET